MLRNVVVGVDGSVYGRHALEWAAREVVGQVTAVHAVSPMAELIAAVFQIDTGPYLHRVRRQLNDEWVSGVDAPLVTVRTRVIEDSPTQAMLHVADEIDAEAIVVGVRGLESSGRLIGATAGQLVHLSTRPVIVVPSAEDINSGASTIVVAVTGHADEDNELLHWATKAGMDGNIKLRFVYADTSTPDPRAPNGASNSAAARRLDEWLAGQGADRAWEVEVITADPITALVDASRDAALVVIGSHRSTRLAAYLNGALANHLPTVSCCPVAMVPLTATRP